MAKDCRVLNALKTSAQVYHNRWLFIARPTIIDLLVDYLAIFTRGLLAGRASGSLLHPEAEVFKNTAWCVRTDDEANYFHPPSAPRTAEEARPIDLFGREVCPNLTEMLFY